VAESLNSADRTFYLRKDLSLKYYGFGFPMNTMNRLKIRIDPAGEIRKLGGMLILEIVVILCPYSSHRAIGKRLYSTEPVVFSLQESNEKGSQSFQDLLRDLQKDNSYDRQRAAIALGNAKDAGAVEPLIKSLRDDDDFVRSFAARSLGNIRDPKALNPLINALSDKHVLVRRSAAWALGSLGDARAVDPLVNALENKDFLVQRSAAEALGQLRDPRAVDPLIKALGNEDSYIQTGAANALARIGEAAIPKLVAELGEPKMGPRAAEILKELNWQPSSEQEKALYDIALKNR
jgi:HEAT repeat protein